MLRELLSIFRASDPVGELSQDFKRMLGLSDEMVVTAGQVFFGEVSDNDGTRSRLTELDKQLNQFEQTIRRKIFTHLTVHGRETDVSFALSLMSMVKDVERLGDYAKNLAQLGLVDSTLPPEGPATNELKDIRTAIERFSHALPTVFFDSQKEEALASMRHGRELGRRCETLVTQIARSGYDSGTTTVLVLGTRYYKRVAGHLLNVLSGVLMPLDKLDHYDEEEFRSV